MPVLNDDYLLKFLNQREYRVENNPNNIMAVSKNLWRSEDQSWLDIISVTDYNSGYFVVKVNHGGFSFSADYQTDDGISQFDEISDFCPMNVFIDGDYVPTHMLLGFARECFDLCRDLLNWYFQSTQQPCRAV